MPSGKSLAKQPGLSAYYSSVLVFTRRRRMGVALRMRMTNGHPSEASFRCHSLLNPGFSRSFRKKILETCKGSHFITKEDVRETG
jgi:hypothetical protein